MIAIMIMKVNLFFGEKALLKKRIMIMIIAFVLADCFFDGWSTDYFICRMVVCH